MIRLRSTSGCTSTPRARFALEELGAPYEVEIVPSGSFVEAFGIPGPELVDDGYSVVEITAVLRHVARRFGHGTLWPADLRGQAEVDRWIDFQAVRIGKAAATRDLATLLTLFGALDDHLAARAWLLGDAFTIDDCAFVATLQKRATLPVDRHPAVGAYLDRLAARPAWTRVQSY